jgi:glycosyltransferase involved in cell wall biosynthesis
MRVGYDAQAFLSGNAGTGKGAHLRTLLGPFLDRFVGFASTDPNISGLPLVQEGASGYNVWQQLSLPSSLRRHRIDLFLAPSNTAPRFLPTGIDLVLVLHDTILMQGFRKPDIRGQILDKYRRWQIPYSVARARLVVTVSDTARADRLNAFPNTVPSRWFEPAAPLSRRDGYLLLVTSAAPHKNALGAFHAYAKYVRQVGREARKLKIVGLSHVFSTFQKQLEDLGISPLVTLLPFVSEHDLLELYRGAAALLLPSFAEGFGIPMIEAMATGTPVIASRSASLPEVGGDAAMYFDPHDTENIAATLSKALTSDCCLADMASKGLARAANYHPDVVGAQVSAFWRELGAG